MYDILKYYYDIDANNIEPLSGGWMNGKYIVTSNKNKYVLKVYNHKNIEKMSNGEFYTNYLDNQMLNNLRIVNYMNELKLNCPKVIPTIFSDLIVKYGNDRLTLMTYINGKNVDRKSITGIQLCNLGNECCKMHNLFKNVSDELYVGKYLALPTLNDLENRLIYNTSIVSAETSKEFIELLKFEKRIIRKLCDTNIIDEIPIGIIHGDFADDNIIFSNDAPYIVDFELVRKNSYLQDIGRILLSYCFDDGVINFGRINNFKAGYDNLNYSQILLSLVIVWINEINMWIKSNYFSRNLTLKAKRFQDELIYLTINLESIIDLYFYCDNEEIIGKYKSCEKKLVRR